MSKSRKDINELEGLEYTNRLREDTVRDLKRSIVFSKEFADQIWSYLEVTQRIAFEEGIKRGREEMAIDIRAKRRKKVK